mmetsp:Transcript_5489/g.13553  ORF Transcript_5489/g.13553 Transcript_5489/m.13553 type:complete len:207 (-) Transcript_5489:704-1324(-)
MGQHGDGTLAGRSQCLQRRLPAICAGSHCQLGTGRSHRLAHALFDADRLRDGVLDRHGETQDLQRRLRRHPLARTQRGLAQPPPQHDRLVHRQAQRILSQLRIGRSKTIHVLPRDWTRIRTPALGRGLFQQGSGKLHGLHTTTGGVQSTRRLQFLVPGATLRGQRRGHQRRHHRQTGTGHGRKGPDHHGGTRRRGLCPRRLLQNIQ